MSRLDGVIIFTDLDGTLLDHQTYSFKPAMPVLELLGENNVPIIPVTSKTRCELMHLRAKLNLHTPFVVENGAGIYIPKGYFDFNDDSLEDEGEFWVKRFGPKRSELSTFLDTLPASLRSVFKSFSDLGDEKIAELTGLSLEQARWANQREFSDPIYWQGDEAQARELQAIAQSAGLETVMGGRFMHLTNGYDKGQGLYWLKQQYMKQSPRQDMHAIALGDSENDLDMLEAADQAIVIRNTHTKALALADGVEAMRSSMPGPEGWAEALKGYLNLNIK